jgi:hypothetical protein
MFWKFLDQLRGHVAVMFSSGDGFAGAFGYPRPKRSGKRWHSENAKSNGASFKVGETTDSLAAFLNSHLTPSGWRYGIKPPALLENRVCFG